MVLKALLLRKSRCHYRYYNTINNEVEKFSKIGKDWWDKDSNKGTGPLHSMNPTRGTMNITYSIRQYNVLTIFKKLVLEEDVRNRLASKTPAVTQRQYH